MTIREKIRDAYRNNRAATCVALARHWLRDHPDDVRIIHDYAEMLYKMARYEEAVRVYTDALKRFPTDRWGICNQLGHLYRYRGAFREAELWYQRAIDEDPEEACSYIFLGAVQARQGRLDEAERTHSQAAQCSQGSIDEAYLNLGLVLRGQGRLAEAKTCFEKAIAIDEKYSDAIEALNDVTSAIEVEGQN